MGLQLSWAVLHVFLALIQTTSSEWLWQHLALELHVAWRVSVTVDE